MYTGKLQYPQNIISYGSLFRGDEKPIGDTFHSALRYLNDGGKSIRYGIKIRGYSREDISYLIVSMFGVEEAFEGVFMGESTPVSQASFSYKYLTEGSHTFYDRDGSLVFDFGNFISEANEIENILLPPLADVPLYLNGTELQKIIANWRLIINK